MIKVILIPLWMDFFTLVKPILQSNKCSEYQKRDYLASLFLFFI